MNIEILYSSLVAQNESPSLLEVGFVDVSPKTLTLFVGTAKIYGLLVNGAFTLIMEQFIEYL